MHLNSVNRTQTIPSRLLNPDLMHADHANHFGRPTMRQDNFEAVKDLLDQWANWLGTWESLGKGVPRSSPGAPDARIQSFEDLEIESEKIIVRAVHTCVYELPPLQRDVVLLYYGFIHRAWKPGDDALFELAQVNLYHALAARIAVCR